MPEYVVNLMRVNALNRNNTIISEQVARETLQKYMDHLVQQEMVKTYKIYVDKDTAEMLKLKLGLEERE